MAKPDLPDGIPWPDRTRDWWKAWIDSSLTDEYTPVQWEYLYDTALVHAVVWGGDVSKAGELRGRIERLGGLSPEKSEGVASPSDPIDEIASRRAARGGATARKGRAQGGAS